MKAKWILGIGDQEEVQNADWDQIAKALLKMDGDTVTIVSLRLADEGGMLAGGGNDGWYIVTYFPDNSGKNSLMLTDTFQTGQDVKLTVQTPAEYPARWCVKLPMVVKVFEYFFRTNEIPRDMRWEFDNSPGVTANPN